MRCITLWPCCVEAQRSAKAWKLTVLPLCKSTAAKEMAPSSVTFNIRKNWSSSSDFAVTVWKWKDSPTTMAMAIRWHETLLWAQLQVWRSLWCSPMLLAAVLSSVMYRINTQHKCDLWWVYRLEGCGFTGDNLVKSASISTSYRNANAKNKTMDGFMCRWGRE